MKTRQNEIRACRRTCWRSWPPTCGSAHLWEGLALVSNGPMACAHRWASRASGHQRERLQPAAWVIANQRPKNAEPDRVLVDGSTHILERSREASLPCAKTQWLGPPIGRSSGPARPSLNSRRPSESASACGWPNVALAQRHRSHLVGRPRRAQPRSQTAAAEPDPAHLRLSDRARETRPGAHRSTRLAA